MSAFADDGSETRVFETYEFPLTIEDNNAIKLLLRTEGILAPSFIPRNEDIYDPLMYRREELHHETPTILLADRNIVSLWLDLLNGAKASSEHRIAAAVLAFAQSANMQVEPNLALYEAAATSGTMAANDELGRFRVIDNIHPCHWAEVAVGRASNLSLSASDLPAPPINENIDFNMPLRRWRRNYIILLKLAELDLRGLKRVDQLTEFTKWMYQDFILGSPALIFAIYYLTPNSARRAFSRTCAPLSAKEQFADFATPVGI